MQFKRHKKLFNQKPIQRQIMKSKGNVSETLYNVFIYLRSDFFESVYVLAMILERYRDDEVTTFNT